MKDESIEIITEIPVVVPDVEGNPEFAKPQVKDGTKKQRKFIGSGEAVRKEPITPKITRSGRVFDYRRYSINQGRYSMTAAGYKQRKRRELAKELDDAHDPTTSETSAFRDILVDELDMSVDACDQSSLDLALSPDADSVVFSFNRGALEQRDEMDEIDAALDPDINPSLSPASVTESVHDEMAENKHLKQLYSMEEPMEKEEAGIDESTNTEVDRAECLEQDEAPDKNVDPDEDQKNVKKQDSGGNENYSISSGPHEKQSGRKKKALRGRKRIPVVTQLHPSLLLSPPKISCLKEPAKEGDAESRSNKNVHWIDDKENISLCDVKIFELPESLRKCTLKKKVYTG